MGNIREEDYKQPMSTETDARPNLLFCNWHIWRNINFPVAITGSSLNNVHFLNCTYLSK